MSKAEAYSLFRENNQLKPLFELTIQTLLILCSMKGLLKVFMGSPWFTLFHFLLRFKRPPGIGLHMLTLDCTCSPNTRVCVLLSVLPYVSDTSTEQSVRYKVPLEDCCLYHFPVLLLLDFKPAPARPRTPPSPP